MAGYIGAKQGVTQVDGYNRSEADAEFVQVTGDTMTGALAVNGNFTVDTDTLFVDAASNNVGIGTATPNAAADLHVADTSDARIWVDATSGDTMELYAGIGIGVFNRSNSYLMLGTNNAERLRITSAGSVGIGTTNPTQEIHGYSSGGDFSLKLESASATGTAYTYYKNADREWATGIRGTVEDSYQVIDVTADLTRLTIDSSGNVGIGTSAPSQKLTIDGTSSGAYIAINNAGSGDISSGFLIYNGENLDASIYTNPTFGNTTILTREAMAFRAGGAERMRIASNGYVGFAVSSPTYMIHLNGGAATFNNSGIAAAWNVHSDYRLKENVVEFSGASSLVSQLRPVKFSWVGEDQSEATTAGFIAHEMAEVAPYSVIGEKDAVNEDGSIKSQAADYSKLVPLLTAALQEALTEIQDLKARVATLEGGAA
jgi:hypothetical protein